MKRLAIPGILFLLMTLVLGLIGPAAVVTADEPDNTALVNFTTSYACRSNADVFTNAVVTGRKSWGVDFSNWPDPAALPLSDVTVSLNTTLLLSQASGEPVIEDPPYNLYQWQLGDIPDNQHGQINLGTEPPPNVEFTPGLDISRSADTSVFSEPGTQTMTVNVTPRRPMNHFWVMTGIQDDNQVTATIVSPTGGDPNVFPTPDGNGINIWCGNPVVDTTYTFQIVFNVVPKLGEVEFMPTIAILAGGVDVLFQNTVVGTGFTYDMPELGTWTVSSGSTCQWSYQENSSFMVHLDGRSYSTQNQVNLLYFPSWIYGIDGDSFTNSSVTGFKTFGTSLVNIPDGSALPVSGAQLTLETPLQFDWGSQPGQEPPLYTWEFGDLPENQSSVVNLGSSLPVTFTPGFDAFRSANTTYFTGPAIQHLTVTVVPREEGGVFSFRVMNADLPDVRAEIISPTEGEWVVSDGSSVVIYIPNPSVGVSYSFDIEIAITPKTSPVSFLPQVEVCHEMDIASGSASGLSFGHPASDGVEDIGTWTWYSSDNLTYQWTDRLKEDVSFRPLVQQSEVGGISGSITDATTSQPLAGVPVLARDAATQQEVATVMTGPDGTYYIPIPAGTYRVKAQPVNAGLPYADRFYGDQYFNPVATPVSVSAGAVTSGIDIHLETAGTISGTVYDDATGLPAAGVMVSADNFTTDWIIAFTTSGPDGSYTLHPPTGTYKVTARCWSMPGLYANQFYDNHDFIEDGEPVTLTAPDALTGYDFHMRIGGTISGTLTDALTGQPLQADFVYFYDAVTGKLVNYATLAVGSGSYVCNLPPGDYLVRTVPLPLFQVWYAEEYYDDAVTAADATPVHIAPQTETSGIDFSLVPCSPTPVGDNITVNDAASGATVVFDTVTVEGCTTVRTSSTPPAPPVGFTSLGTYYDVITSVAYSSNVTVTLPYDNTGMTPKEEAQLQLYCWNGSAWQDVTLLPVDTAGNLISGVVSSLSWFAIGWPAYQVTWLPPLSTKDPYPAQLNRTIPVKFQVTDTAGQLVPDLDITVTVTNDEGGAVVFSGNAGYNSSHGYHVNVKTKGWDSGSYTIRVSADPEVSYHLEIVDGSH